MRRAMDSTPFERKFMANEANEFLRDYLPHPGSRVNSGRSSVI
jgi:hypothetical protein